MKQVKQVLSNKTELKDRTLFYDGDSVIPAADIIKTLSAGKSIDGLFVTELTDEIRKFNSFVPVSEQIKVKESVDDCTLDWMLPDEYAELDPVSYVANIFYDSLNDIPLGELDGRKKRLIQELRLYEELKLIPILRVLIFIINTLEEKNLVWGVGRGSSVSSYVLYILGVHDVDSFKYELDITDFLRI